MTEKIDVIGNNAHPFFNWAKENYGKSAIPKWNFHKIIIGKDESKENKNLIQIYEHTHQILITLNQNFVRIVNHLFSKANHLIGESCRKQQALAFLWHDLLNQ